jgi:nucleotide-binding universal stress UspA family protein
LLQERLAAQREEVRGRAAEIEEALGELDERRREAEHREALLAAEDERLADMLTQVRIEVVARNRDASMVVCKAYSKEWGSPGLLYMT